jgi:hypothetical protein
LLIVATQVTLAPVVAVAGAVSVTARSAGKADKSFTRGNWNMKIWLIDENALAAALSASPFCPQRTIFWKFVE